MLRRLRALRALRWLWLRECFIFVAFLAITALMIWPWVTRLRDAVYDNGDSYAFAWSLWWNFHQTFHDPLNLFQANIFFPYRYTLAFTEHGYGVAILFFPLFAVGLRPLTVYSVATFCAFAFSGYGAFRLARTLTTSSGAAWVAGVVFAFIPYHFMFITGLPYLFMGWVPISLEALVLFARQRSWRRAAWLGLTFLMHGLTCITWLLLSLIPFALCGAVLATRHRLWRERGFWLRGLLALSGASLMLLPFLYPYYQASKLYGFRRDAGEVARNSAALVDWLTAPGFNRVWKAMGSGLPNVKATLFTGFLPLLLALLALFVVSYAKQDPPGVRQPNPGDDRTSKGWLRFLDALVLAAGIIAIISRGFSNAPTVGVLRSFLNAPMADRALVFLTFALIARCCISYPRLLQARTEGRNLIESLRTTRRDDAFWLGIIWAGFGLICSFGMYVYFYRVLYDLVLPFQSLRAPCRAAMLSYLGLAVLAGIGADKLAQVSTRRNPTINRWAIYAVLVGALLFELHASPFPILRGAVYPDAVTLRLAALSMRGAVIDLPSLPEPPYYSWHLSMLRSADHGHPTIFAASSFIPPLTMKAHDMTRQPTIPREFLDVLEQMQVSYLVFHRSLVPADREAEFETFFTASIAARRLQPIGRYGNADLYAVVKTEPEAKADER
jgi:hypothetical protein